ncbi:hypothetical protein BDW71DRAFT_205448 [Aspergillus fruticulosus]
MTRTSLTSLTTFTVLDDERGGDPYLLKDEEMSCSDRFAASNLPSSRLQPNADRRCSLADPLLDYTVDNLSALQTHLHRQRKYYVDYESEHVDVKTLHKVRQTGGTILARAFHMDKRVGNTLRSAPDIEFKHTGDDRMENWAENADVQLVRKRLEVYFRLEKEARGG